MKKISRVIASLMLVVAAVFFLFALNHPEGSWPWSNGISYVLYGIYAVVMIILFIAPFKGKNK